MAGWEWDTVGINVITIPVSLTINYINAFLPQLQDLSFIQILPEGTLKIVGTQDADAGEYECLATNEAGSHKETVELQVGSNSEIFQFLVFSTVLKISIV